MVAIQLVFMLDIRIATSKTQVHGQRRQLGPCLCHHLRSQRDKNILGCQGKFVRIHTGSRKILLGLVLVDMYIFVQSFE